MKRDLIIDEMKMVFKNIPFGIDHTLRVLANADEIMAGELVDAHSAVVVTFAAILHDIGVVRANEKYGSMDAHFQELEGPAVVEEILERQDVDQHVIERVIYIVGHHHTPEKIDQLDFQILWDADVLDALEFGNKKYADAELRKQVEASFQTKSGKELAYKRLGL